MTTRDVRPDPDKLLALVQTEQGERAHGHLKIFFGASAGVGKTYAMLSEAQREQAAGRDVLIGVIEHHGRSETKALIQGLAVLPLLEISHRGVTVREFDLDGALARRPSLILMDEYAHTNAMGSRHPKRWQDVAELLDAGIDVFTTLNVQHLESVNDQVASLTGIRVRETVPDNVFDAADEIALIDIASDELLKRLADGKVYVAEGANTRAAENFFKKTNLLALRELALRRTAERVDAQSDQLNAALGHDEAALGEKIMVLVGHDALSERLIRHTRRMAARAKAPWVALYLQTDRHEMLSDTARQQIESNLNLAEKLGATVIRLPGGYAATSILTYAQQNGFTRIVVGNRKMPFWRLGKSLSQKLVERGSGLEITTLGSETTEAPEPAHAKLWRAFIARPRSYALSILMVAAVTIGGLPMRGTTGPDTLLLLYLTVTVISAARYGIGPSLFASALSVATFNWFYTEPYYTFSFYDPHYYFTFAFMLATSLIVGSLTAQLSRHAQLARRGEQETRLLYDLTRGLSAVRSAEAMSEVAARHLGQAFGVAVRVWVRDAQGLSLWPKDASASDLKETGVVQWVSQNAQTAGRHTNTLPSAPGLYLPLIAEGHTLGVLGLVPADETRRFTGAEKLVLETVASLIAGALQRANRANEAENSRIDSENEKLRNVLLASLSHDLKTPLTIMNGGLSSLLKMRKELPRKAIDELTGLWGQLTHLQKFVANLLRMAAIASGQLKLNFQPYLVPEIVGAAIGRMAPQKGARHIRTVVTGQLPMVEIDGALIEQVLINLLDNAIQHTSSDGIITVTMERDADCVRIRVGDNGDGIKSGDEELIFDKFQSEEGDNADRHGNGSGLGLAICRGIIQAHGGMIYAKNNPKGTPGASFIFTLPTARAIS